MVYGGGGRSGYEVTARTTSAYAGGTSLGVSGNNTMSTVFNFFLQ